jgi:ABC-type lipoprotein export system ATPase subunit
VLKIRQLSRSFSEGAREHRVLDGAEASVARGEIVAVMGRSGAGKSTLLNLVSGIDRPDSGTVEVDGRNVSALGEPQRTLYRRAQVGFVYQFFNLIPTLDVAENVRLVLELNGVRGGAARERTRAVLAAVGLDGRAASRIDQLSGGEQQRVAVARAFVNRPMILIADEPTGNLDPETSDGIMKLLDRINRTGTTVVMVTHDQAIVNQMRKRVLELDQGALVRDQSRGVYGYVR